MPPYANQQQHDDYVRVLNGTNYDSDLTEIPLDSPNYKRRVIERAGKKIVPFSESSWDTTTSKSQLPTPPPPPIPDDDDAADATDDDNDNKKKPSALGRMLDFNPCAAKIPNPGSALFKERRCHECGSKVYKYRDGGYEKEVVVKQRPIVVDDDVDVEEEESVRTPALADDATALSNEDDDDDDEETAGGDGSCCGCSSASSAEESAVSATTTHPTLGVETKIYFHKSCYVKHKQRKAHRAGGYDLVLTDLLDYHTLKEERERQALEEAEQLDAEAAEKAALERAAAEEAERVAAAEARSLKGRAKKAAKSVKKAFSLKGCFGGAGATAVVATAAPTAPKVAPPGRPVQLSWGDHEERTFAADLDDDTDDEVVAPLNDAPQQQQQRPVQLSWGGRQECVSEENGV